MFAMRPTAPVFFTALVIALLTLLGIVTRYLMLGDFNALHSLFALFFSTNLVICYWEICLFLHRHDINQRAAYWQQRQGETGCTPALEFLTSPVPLKRMLSPGVWADVWATYSILDPSYRQRDTFAFNVDIGNGFVTPLPSLLLYAAYTVDFIPALIAGILGTMLFWQWVYASSLYLVSFFVAGRQTELTRVQLFASLLLPNAFWVLVPMLGLYLSVRLILDGNYAVLGF